MASYDNPPRSKPPTDSSDGLTPLERARKVQEEATKTLTDSKSKMAIARVIEEDSRINYRDDINEAAAIAAEEIVREGVRRQEQARRDAEIPARADVETMPPVTGDSAILNSRAQWSQWLAELAEKDPKLAANMENIKAGEAAAANKKKADPLADFDLPTQEVEASVDTDFKGVPVGFTELPIEGGLETEGDDRTISESGAVEEETEESMTVSASVPDTTPGRQRFNRDLTKDQVQRILDEAATDPRYREITNPDAPKKISTADASSVASTAPRELPPTDLIQTVVDSKKSTPETEKKAPSRLRGWLKKIGLLFGLGVALSSDRPVQEYSTASIEPENTTMMVDDSIDDTGASASVQASEPAATESSLLPAAKGVDSDTGMNNSDAVDTVSSELENESAANIVRTHIETGEGVSQAMLRLGYDISDIQAALHLPVTIGSETKTLADVFVDAKGGDLGMTIVENPEGGIASIDFYSGDSDKVVMPATELSSVMHFTSSPEAAPQSQESTGVKAVPQPSEVSPAAAPIAAVSDRAPVQGVSIAVTPDVPPTPTPVITGSDAPAADIKKQEAVVARKPEETPVADERKTNEPTQFKTEGPDRRSLMDPERQLHTLEDMLDQMEPGTEVYYSPFVLRIAEEGGEVQIRHIADGQHYYTLTPMLIQTLGFNYRADKQPSMLRASFRDIVAGQGLDPIPR